MKKYIALLSALSLAFSLCGCESKNNDSETPTDSAVETDTTSASVSGDGNEGGNAHVSGEDTSKPPFREYVHEDFTPVTLNLNTLDKDPPADLKCVDISKLDFGERMSPCKAEDVRKNYGYYEYNPDEELDEEAIAERERQLDEICSKPYKGYMTETAFLDGCFYFAVNFDDYCTLHDSSLFRFDPETQKCEEVDTRTGLEYKGCYNTLCGYGDKLYYSDMKLSEDDTSAIYSYDVNTGETETFTEVNENISYLRPTQTGLFVEFYVFDEDTQQYSMEHWLYDYETKGAVAVSEGIAEQTYYQAMVFCDNEPVRITGGDETENGGYYPITVRTQYYKITTEIKEYDGIFPWKDKLSILARDPSDHRYCILTYDLNTMEYTKMSITDYYVGSFHKAGNGIFVCSRLKFEWGKEDYTLFYLMPELGTMFKLDDNIGYFSTYDESDAAYLITSRLPAGHDEQSGAMNSQPEKIYWVDDSE